MKYKVHRFDIDMTKGPNKLEEYLNSLKGEIVAIIPNIKKNNISPNIWCYKENRFFAHS